MPHRDTGAHPRAAARILLLGALALAACSGKQGVDHATGSGTPSNSQRTDMNVNELRVEPNSQPLGDLTASAQLRHDRDQQTWDLTVVLSKGPDSPPIPGADVQAQLLDDKGQALELASSPPAGRPLVEVGGGLGKSANAAFSFRGAAPPSALRVTYQGATAEFRVGAP